MSWIEIIHLSRKLTLLRIMNFFLMKFSFYYSRITRNPRHLAYPVSVSVEPTTSCNLRCPECPSGKREFSRPTGMMDLKIFERVLSLVYKKSVWMTFYFQGEPFLNPDFMRMVEKAHQKKLFTSTSTNAHYLSIENCEKVIDSGLDKIIISIDGLSQETYEKYRVGGKLSKVKDGISNLVKVKREKRSKTPLIELQFLVNAYNNGDIQAMKKYAKESGAEKVVFKTIQVYGLENNPDLIPSDLSLSRYKKLSDGNLAVNSPLSDHCYRLWHSCVVTWNGNLVPCCFDKDASYPAGSLIEKDFDELWNGEKIIAFRKNVLTNRKAVDICSNCSEGGKVYI